MNNSVKTLIVILFVVFTANNLTAEEWVNFNDNTQSQPEITVLSSDNNHTIIKCEITGMLKDIVFANEENWDKLYFNTATAVGYSGEPLVPRIWKKIAIPSDSDVQVNILSSEYITLSNYNVYPFQQVIGDEIPTFQQDMNIYNQNEFYPENIISISEPMIMRDYRIVQIEISPIHYNPVTHQIKAYTQIEIELVYSGHNNINILTNTRDVIPERVASMYKSSILNYDSVSKGIRDDTHKRILFIGKEIYTDCLPELIEWERKKGYYVDIYDPFSIGASSAEEIKDYITDYYNDYSSTWDIYVILIGDIPYGIMLETQQYEPQEYFSSDHYYSMLTGDDYLPEISVGRISRRDSVDYNHATPLNYEEIFHNYAHKVVQYETSPYQIQEDWFNNIVFAASRIVNPGDELFEVCKDESDDFIDPSQYTINYQYGEDGATNSSLISALDDGCIIWNFAAHGQNDCWRLWSAPPIMNFSHEQVYSLQNSGIPVVYSLSCYTALVEVTNHICLGEMLLNKDSSGAIAFLGFT